MAGLYGGSSGSGGLYGKSGGSSAAAAPHKPSGVGGFIENLGGDIVHTVAGMPAGLVHLAEHPVGSVEQMAKGTWQTWSPLFEGHVGQFAHNFYDHPLAPILDVASLFSLGVGGAAKLGELTAADEGSLLGKAAALKVPKEITLKDPKGLETGKFRPDVPFNYSTRPAKRLMQEHVLPAIGRRLPQGVQDTLANTRYTQKLHTYMIHRSVAKSLVLGSVLKASHDIVDPATAPALRRKLAVGMYLNFAKHATRMTPEDAIAHLMSHPHETVIRDATTLGGSTQGSWARAITRARAEERKAQTLVDRHGPRANALPSLQAEHDRQMAQYQKMLTEGYRVAHPARTKLKEPTVKQAREAKMAPLRETYQNIKMLRRQIRKAQAAKNLYEPARAKLEQAMGRRMDIENRAWMHHFEHVSTSEENFSHFANNLGRVATVRMARGRSRATVEHAISVAAKDAKGRVMVVPYHDAVTMGRELNNSTGMLAAIGRKPTMLWKTIQVRWTPRTLTNNGVGNMLLYTLRHDPVTAATGLWHASKILKGEKTAGRDFVNSLPISSQHWFWRNFGPEMHNVFGADAIHTTGRAARLKSGFYPLVHEIADKPIRAASIVNSVKNDPLVQTLMREKNLTFDQAASRALKSDAGGAIRNRAVQHARSVAGDYQAMTGMESKIRNVAPFYMWDRHALRSTKAILTETPTKAVALQAIGQQGHTLNQQLLGNVPQYLEGSIPLQLFGIHGAGDRTKILTTTSLNPFSTVGDVAQMAQALTAGHNVNAGNALFSQVNPFITGAISYGAGKNIETGAPEQTHAGLLTSILANMGMNFPEYKLVQGMIEPAQTTTAKGRPKVLTNDETSALTSFLGVPIRKMSKSAAQTAALYEVGQKPSKRKKSGGLY